MSIPGMRSITPHSSPAWMAVTSAPFHTTIGSILRDLQDRRIEVRFSRGSRRSILCLRRQARRSPLRSRPPPSNATPPSRAGVTSTMSFSVVAIAARFVEVSTSPGISALMSSTPCGSAEIVRHSFAEGSESDLPDLAFTLLRHAQNEIGFDGRELRPNVAFSSSKALPAHSS